MWRSESVGLRCILDDGQSVSRHDFDDSWDVRCLAREMYRNYGARPRRDGSLHLFHID